MGKGYAGAKGIGHSQLERLLRKENIFPFIGGRKETRFGTKAVV